MLYRHTLLTADQAANLLNYRPKTVYGMASALKREGLLLSLFLPFLRMNHRGYTLSLEGARAASRLTGDEESFRSGNWKAAPVQLEHFFGANDFFIALIRYSLSHTGEGLLEWLDPREAAERYVQTHGSGRKSRPVKPDGMGTYLLPGRGRLVFHLEYDTGTEATWRLKEKLFQYGLLLPKLWPRVEAVNVLVVTKIASRPQQLLEMWKGLCEGSLSGIQLPNVWVIHEKEWQLKGVKEARWRGRNGQQLRFRELPVLSLPSELSLPILGKQLREASPLKGRGRRDG